MAAVCQSWARILAQPSLSKVSPELTLTRMAFLPLLTRMASAINSPRKRGRIRPRPSQERCTIGCNVLPECRRYICLFILWKHNLKIVRALDLWVVLQFTLWSPELLNNNRAHVLEAASPRQRPREANRSIPATTRFWASPGKSSRAEPRVLGRLSFIQVSIGFKSLNR